MLGTLKDRAVKLPSSLLTALSNAISEARAHLDNAHLFEKVAAAYEAGGFFSTSTLLLCFSSSYCDSS